MRPLGNQPLVDGHIIRRHAGDVEAPFEGGAARWRLRRWTFRVASIASAIRVHHEAGDALVNDFHDRAAAKRHDRSAAGQRLDHDQPERLGPVNRKEQRRGAAEERGLLRFADFADELHQRVVEQMADLALEVGAVRRIHLGGNS